MRARKLTYKGKTRTLTQWARLHGMTVQCLYSRLKSGKDLATALETPRTPFRHRRFSNEPIMLTYRGVTLSLSQWSKKTNILLRTLHRRWQRGWPVEKILNRGQKLKRGSEARIAS